MNGLRLTDRGRRVLDAAALAGWTLVGTAGVWAFITLAAALAGTGVGA